MKKPRLCMTPWCSYVAEIMHEMHSGSVPTIMLAVLKLVKVLIFVNMYGMGSTSVLNLPMKPIVVVSTKKPSIGMKYMH